MVQLYPKGGCLLKSLVSSHFGRCSAGWRFFDGLGASYVFVGDILLTDAVLSSCVGSFSNVLWKKFQCNFVDQKNK